MSQNETILRFHQIHGPNIHLSNSNTTARRVAPDSSLVYSSHPLKPLQKFSLKLSEISDRTQEILSIGFTQRHPSENHERTYSIKIVSLKKNYHVKNKTLYFYYATSGNVHFGIDGVEKGCRDGKIPTESQLWAFIHITNPSTTIEVLNCQLDWTNLSLTPMLLHQSRGRNVKLVKNAVYKYDRRLSMSYAFTVNPLRIGEHVIVKILDVDSRKRGKLVLGLTGCNPSLLEQKDLPDDVGLFLTKPGYWLTASDASWDFKQNDKISFVISADGKIKIWRNDCTLLKEAQVNTSLKLWAFFDIANLEGVEVSSHLSEFEIFATDWKEVKNEVITSKQDLSDDEDASLCVVCCENVIDAALYPCGHMCMCYGCAREQWRGAGHGACPMCRVKIKDVLKIYKI